MRHPRNFSEVSSHVEPRARRIRRQRPHPEVAPCHDRLPVTIQCSCLCVQEGEPITGLSDDLLEVPPEVRFARRDGDGLRVPSGAPVEKPFTRRPIRGRTSPSGATLGGVDATVGTLDVPNPAVRRGGRKEVTRAPVVVLTAARYGLERLSTAVKPPATYVIQRTSRSSKDFLRPRIVPYRVWRLPGVRSLAAA
jgi:hypothetical protein